jgi:hypothetical protein
MKKRNIAIGLPSMGIEEWEACRGPIESGWITQGPKVKEFEINFANRHQVKHAFAVSNCTTALHLGLLACGVKEGDEVIVPAFTWVSTANAVKYCGATPIFVDIDINTFNIDIEKIAEKITDKFTIKNLPSISILVAGLGLDKEIVDRALLRLPKSVSLGFVPYASHFDYADINDRDLLMNIPMETHDYFFKDNGPYSLICKLGVDNNSKRLEYIISKSNDFNGYYTEMDESFTDDIRDLNFLLKRISETNKHILYNDPKEIKSFRDLAIKFGMKDRILRVDSVINQKMSEIELIKRLDDLKLIASARGYAIVIINASVNNIDILEKWIKTVAKSLKYNIVTIDELRGKIIKREVTK